MDVDRNGLEILGRDACLRLLAAVTIGRIGIGGALPVVLPVNFRLVDDRVVFRTGIGTKLDAASTDSVVAFEVDDFDPISHTGWSVVVSGTAREVTDPRGPHLATTGDFLMAMDSPRGGTRSPGRGR